MNFATLRPALPIALFLLLAACGSSNNSSTTATPLTASTFASDVVSLHSHTEAISLADLTPTPTTGVYQYRSSVDSGHSHVIALSSAQIIDLNNGMRVDTVSSQPSSGAPHTHGWMIEGGVMLYDKACYNCHGNGKRGAGRTMNDGGLSSMQKGAIMNPAGAQLSTSAGATPNPNF